MIVSMMESLSLLLILLIIEQQLTLMILIPFFKLIHLKTFHSTEIYFKKFQKFKIIKTIKLNLKRKDFNMINSLYVKMICLWRKDTSISNICLVKYLRLSLKPSFKIKSNQLMQVELYQLQISFKGNTYYKWKHQE